MNKQKLIAAIKKQIQAGEVIMEVSKQNYETAARCVSEAKSVLIELGGSAGQTRKGKGGLTPEEILSLKAGITKVKNN